MIQLPPNWQLVTVYERNRVHFAVIQSPEPHVSIDISKQKGQRVIVGNSPDPDLAIQSCVEQAEALERRENPRVFCDECLWEAPIHEATCSRTHSMGARPTDAEQLAGVNTDTVGGPLTLDGDTKPIDVNVGDDGLSPEQRADLDDPDPGNWQD